MRTIISILVALLTVSVCSLSDDVSPIRGEALPLCEQVSVEFSDYSSSDSAYMLSGGQRNTTSSAARVISNCKRTPVATVSLYRIYLYTNRLITLLRVECSVEFYPLSLVFRLCNIRI